MSEPEITPETVGRAIDAYAARGVIDGGRRLLLLAGGVTAGGDDRLLAAFFPAALKRGGDPDALSEIILQTHLFAGYPHTINALFALRDAGAPAPTTTEALFSTPPAAQHPYRERGEALCRRIYGTNYDGLRHNIRTLHPDLDMWMVDEGYGRVLSRPGVDVTTRELAALTALVVLGVPRQLRAHFRGAQNVGASTAEIDEALEQSAIVARADAHETARRVWHELASGQLEPRDRQP